MEVNKVGESARKNLMSYLSNKPIWAFWIAYSAMSGILFGLFYTAMYLLAMRWWIPVIIILAIGIVWGTFAFTKNAREIKAKSET